MIYLVFPSILIVLFLLYRFQKRKLDKEIRDGKRQSKFNRLATELHFTPQVNKNSINLIQMKYNIDNACVVNYNTNKGVEFQYKIQDKIPFKEFNQRLFRLIDSPDQL